MVLRMSLFRKKFTILVVCKANITRSAYLHGYMDFYLKEYMPHLRKKIRIISGGVKARRGSSASRVVKHVARVNHFDLKSHQSDPLSKKMIKKADVILVMEGWQKENILERFPLAKGKTFLLTEYLWKEDDPKIVDIPDPTGQNLVDYEEFIYVAHNEVDRILNEIDRANLAS